MSLSTSQLTKPLKVIRRIQETSDAVSLVLEIPNEFKEKFKYEAGQFVTFFLKIGGEELNRSYSLSSAPEVDSQFQVTIKKVPGGKGSTYLCEKVKEGDLLNTTPPAGHFYKHSTQRRPTQFFLFAAGSGITPIISISKRVLATSDENQVHLLYCNRDETNIILKNELTILQEKYPTRLFVRHTLTQPSEKWQGLKGRITTNAISDFLQTQDGMMAKEYYCCGPSGFMKMVKESLLSLKIAKESIHEESFATPIPANKDMPKNPSWTYIGPGTQDGEPEKIVAIISDEVVEVEAKKGMTILESLMEAGASPPYSCMAGACMACLAKVEEGLLYQEDPGILVEENIEKHETLTCQAKPLSRVVRVSYDNL